jgi:hypothetical protein
MTKVNKTLKASAVASVGKTELSKGGGPAKGPSPSAVARDVSTGQFVDAASRYASMNSASRQIADAKLKSLGIASASGKLSKIYK